MSKASALLVRRSAWLGLAAVIVALAVVPALARARQHIDRRETTRLSIRHSWVAIAPPTKDATASAAPRPIVALPDIVVRVDVARAISRLPETPAYAGHPVLDRSPDPLRGPPACARLS